MTLDSQKLDALLGTMVNELGAAANAALVLLGDKLGLYRAIAEHGPLTSDDLARHTGTRERYVREWLAAQAASGFITYDPGAQTFFLSPEQAAVLADEESVVNMTGGFDSIAAVFADAPRLSEAFQTGDGVGWGDHCNCLFCGTERFFRPDTRRISSANGFRRWMERSRNLPGERRWLTLAAAMAPQRASWRRLFRTPVSAGSIFMGLP